MVKLSVIVPVWNTGENATRLIRKLLAQYDDMEVIAVDDGSSDDSLALLRKLARADKRVRVLVQENSGASAARNTGINISQGEYLMFVDSDDDVAPGYVQKMVRAVEKGAAVMAVCGMEYRRLKSDEKKDVYVSALRMRRNRENTADYVLWLLCRDGRMYSSVNKIYCGEVVRGSGLRFEEGRKFAEDTKFVLDYLAAAGDAKYSSGDIIFVREPLYIYNYGTETSTVKKSALDWANWEKQYTDVAQWAKKMGGGKVSLKSLALLRLLKLRWRISHRRAVKRA